MKKFQFSLESMRNYKEEVLDAHKNTLFALRRDKAQLDRKILDYMGEYDRVNSELLERTKEGITVIEMKSYRFQIENVRMQIKELEKEQQRMQRMVERQIQVVLEASQEVAGLDKLEEKQLEEYRRVLTRADEQSIAEYISTKLVMDKKMASVS